MNENKRQRSPINRFYILDVMRFLAALAVVFYHYSIYFDGTFFEFSTPIANYGYLGVPFFFMLSGFVITASAQNRSAIQFALSRVARLYPAFWACLLFTCAIAIYFKGGIDFEQAVVNSTMLNDYFGVKNIDDVYWTLQAEIKFYGCIFVLIALNLYKYVKTWLVVWLCSTILFHFYSQPFFLGWLINPNYSFYFIGGVCSYLLYENKRNYFILSIFAIALIFSAIKASHQVADFYLASGVFGEYIASGVVVMFYAFFMCLSYGLLNLKPYRIYALMGAISYPLYLCHNRAGKALIDSFSQSLPMVTTIILVIFLILVVSILVHLIVERNLSKAILQIGNTSIQRATNLFARKKARY